VLEVDGVHTYYGESHVLHGVSLAVAAGQVVTILGRNGMGKTTLIRSVIGFTPARRGAIRFKGHDVTRWPPFRMVDLGMGLVPQGRRVFPSLSVRENLEVAARSNGGGWTLERVYTLFPRLKERAVNRANKLSGGEQQMLAIGRALGATIARLKGEGLSILLVEQNLPMALSVADHVHVLSRGQIVHSSSPEELARNHDVQSRYLGV